MALGETGVLVNYRMLPSMRRALRDRAAAEGRSQSDIVRSLIEEYLARPLEGGDDRELASA